MSKESFGAMEQYAKNEAKDGKSPLDNYVNFGMVVAACDKGIEILYNKINNAADDAMRFSKMAKLLKNPEEENTLIQTDYQEKKKLLDKLAHKKNVLEQVRDNAIDNMTKIAQKNSTIKETGDKKIAELKQSGTATSGAREHLEEILASDIALGKLTSDEIDTTADTLEEISAEELEREETEKEIQDKIDMPNIEAGKMAQRLKRDSVLPPGYDDGAPEAEDIPEELWKGNSNAA